MTFSLVARCAETGMFGVAISSSSPAVAAAPAVTDPACRSASDAHADAVPGHVRRRELHGLAGASSGDAP